MNEKGRVYKYSAHKLREIKERTRADFCMRELIELFLKHCQPTQNSEKVKETAYENKRGKKREERRWRENGNHRKFNFGRGEETLKKIAIN